MYCHLPTPPYLLLPAPTYSYLPLPTPTYSVSGDGDAKTEAYLPTPTYSYLLLPTSTYSYLCLPLPTSGLLMATPRGLPTRESLGCQGHCWDAAGRSYQITSESGHTIHRLIFTDFYRFFGLSWETSTINNYHSEDSRDSGSRRTEFNVAVGLQPETGRHRRESTFHLYEVKVESRFSRKP